MTDHVELAGALQQLLTQCANGHEPPQIRDLEPIIAGNSSEMWAFTARWAEADDERLILRRASSTEFGSTGRQTEIALLQLLAGKGVRSPTPLCADPDGAILGRPSVVLIRAEGVADRQLLTDRNALGLDVEARLDLVREAARLLAAIHAVDGSIVGLETSNEPALAELQKFDQAIQRSIVEPMPELKLASLWLHDHLPPAPKRIALVHGDYRPANLLVADAVVTTVLDWEFAHAGDPAEDVGWFLSPYYSREHLIPGRFGVGEFLAAYRDAGGEEVDPDALRYWQVFAMYKLASMTMDALRATVEGDASRLAASADFILRPLLESLVEEATS